MSGRNLWTTQHLLTLRLGDEGLLIKANQRKDDFRKAGVDPAMQK